MSPIRIDIIVLNKGRIGELGTDKTDYVQIILYEKNLDNNQKKR